MTRIEILNDDGTPVRSRRGRHRRSARARRLTSAIRLVLVATATIVFGVGSIFHSWVETAMTPPAAGLPSVAPRPNTNGEARTTRTVYPYSIVPGGVHSAGEARDATEADPLVARHYRDIDISALRLEHVTRPRAVYVSYRRGNVLYWTKRKLILPSGEALLTDGKNEVRARCGNRVSDEVQAPVSDVEPTAEVLDQSAPILVPEQLRSQSLSEWEQPAPLSSLPILEESFVIRPLDADPLPGSPRLFPTLVPLVGDRNFTGGGDVPRGPASVPEPGTVLLVGVGLAGAILRLRRTRAQPADIAERKTATMTRRVRIAAS